MADTDVAVGIDLGTTNSVVACIERASGRPVVVPNRLGEPITPSVVCFDGGRMLVGSEAKEMQAAGHADVAAFFKRQMGDPDFVFHADARDHTATDLSAILLRVLKEDAERALGLLVRRAVITVPAYFRNPQREATLSAGRQAGLEVMQVVNEPTAAALAYGLAGADREQTLLVYDLGGGTFDVTLLRLGPGELRILASDGDHELGGKDWDDRILEFLGSRFQQEFGCDPLGDRESLADLLVRAEEAKKRLSSAQVAPVTLVHAGHRGRYDLERTKFEEITADLLERTLLLTRRVLADQSVRPEAVDGVLLVGGSTRMPMVRDLVQRAFGKPPLTGVNVDEAVALGAAVMAAQHAAAEHNAPALMLPGAIKAVDVTNHSLGLIALNDDRSAYLNSVILPKNRPIPCRQTRPYQHRTRLRGDNLLEIYLTQGDAASPGDVTYLGKYVLHDVPHQPGGLAVVDIEYCYDLSGTVQITGRVRGASDPLRLSVESLPPDVPERFLCPPEETAVTVHVTAYLAFDLSGSMSGAPLEAAQKAAQGFLENTDLTHASIGVIAFADSVRVKLPASQDAREITRAIHGLAIGEVGGANAAHPFDEVRRLLAPVEAPKFVITLADGAWSCQREAECSARAAVSEGIESIAIGFGSADRKFLKAIASSEEASFFTSVGGLVETFTNIAQVLTESQGGTVGPAAAKPARLSFLSRLHL